MGNLPPSKIAKVVQALEPNKAAQEMYRSFIRATTASEILTALTNYDNAVASSTTLN